MNETETIEGEIYEIVYQNEDNGYTVCDVSVNNSLITVCGNMPYIAPGEQVKIEGKWVVHPDYGEQFSAVQIERALPQNVSSILSYLSCGIVSGVRESTAKKIVEKFGEKSLEIIATEPQKLSEIRGISKDKAQKISESFLIRQEAANTIMFLQQYGISPLFSIRVYKKFGQKSVDLIKENPYILCEQIDRIGFKTSDRIAASLNIPINYPKRIQSGIKYALLEASLSGHTCYPSDKLVEYCVKLLKCKTQEVQSHLSELRDCGEIVFENNYCFLPMFYNTELTIAARLCEMVCQKFTPIKELHNQINLIAEKNGISLSKKQYEAVLLSLQKGVVVITGGPGTGKTTIMKIILEILKNNKLTVSLCAPTGKAAKRLTESCNTEAKTIHRLLEVEMSASSDEQKFFRNERNPLETDVIIIDEVSMVDALLFSALLKALKKGTRLIMAGDSDQLPSVGAGNVLHDILSSKKISWIKLEDVFRQAQESKIVINAHRINNGLMPLENDNKSDFFYINKNSEDTLTTICDLCRTRLLKAYGFDPIENIQVLSPSRKGIVGTINLNKVLQQTLNPPQKTKKEKKFGERVFRVGDKVIQTKNNYDIIWTTADTKTEGIGIYNGDIGTIVDISIKNKMMKIMFDENKLVDYDFSSVDELEIAYALTVHKSQGSEWSAVIIPVCQFPPMLMTRNLLYTAVTRARKLVILVGGTSALGKMVANNFVQIRYTGLVKRITEAFDE